MRKFLLFAFLMIPCMGNAQILFFAGSSVNTGYTFLPSVDDLTTQGNPGWAFCYIGNCGGGSPGGNGTPTSVTDTFGVASPSLDGAALQVSMVAPAATQGTNELYIYKVGGNPTADTINNLQMDLWFYCDTNCGTYVKQLEFDQAIFCTSCKYTNTMTNGTNYMFGSQCNVATGIFQVWNQASNSWINATYSGGNIPCTSGGFGSPNTWHHLVETVHKVAGDGTSCTSGGLTYPSDYYDSIILDGVSYSPTNTQLCAGPLTGGFASVWLIQQQMNIGTAGSSGNAASVYYDKENFSYK
jgi:hypothetical protein